MILANPGLLAMESEVFFPYSLLPKQSFLS